MSENPEILSDDTKIVAPSALEGIERAQIDMQITTARRFPRKLSKVKDDMISFATLDEETAAGCFYTLPRGGKTIQGPSVRLAEIAVSCYGNLRAGSRVISVDTGRDNPHVVIQAVAHDLEKNVAITIEKRRRITKKKSKNEIDEDDINLAANAGSAIAFRDAVFKVVPLALIKPVYEQAKLVAIGKATSLGDKRTKIIDRLKQMGATLPNILSVVEARAVEDIDADKLGVLIGLGTALKEGETTIEEAFPTKVIGKGETMADALGEKKAENKTPPVSSPSPADKSTPSPTSQPETSHSVAYSEADLKKVLTEVENLALNLQIPEAALMMDARALGAGAKVSKIKEVPYTMLLKLREGLEVKAKAAIA